MQTDGVNKGETLAGGAARENADGATHENADGAERENADDSARENAGGAARENADGAERENASGATDENADDATRENADISPRRVLIAGAGSYIGMSFARWAEERYPGRIKTKEISMHGDTWRKEDFSKYDAVLHVAGIAHKKTGSVSDREYYDVNARLAIESAKKARREGVSQFILLSSMSIYGDSGSFGRRRVITGDEKPQPTSAYGGSKWLADRRVRALKVDDFRVAVLRPPMVYGSGCKGNYPSLEKMAKKLPVFPDVKNERSMVYIDNLSEFLCQLVLDGRGGVFFPQNRDLVCTADLVRWIAEEGGHRIAVTRALRPAVILASRLPERGPLGRIRGLADKAFGNMAYEPSMSRYSWADYQIIGTRESVREMARAAVDARKPPRKRERAPGRKRGRMIEGRNARDDDVNGAFCQYASGKALESKALGSRKPENGVSGGMTQGNKNAPDASPPQRRVLVLMSTYNGERYLRQQIDSILRQRTRHQVDIRIRDDGSTDGTLRIVNEMMEGNPGRISCDKGENIGANASFFALIGESGGYDYYAISDQDDVWLPDKIERAVAHLEGEGGGIPLLYASPSYLVGDDLKPRGTTRTRKREISIRNTIIQNICPGHSQVFNDAMFVYLKRPLDPRRVYVYDSWITNTAALYGRIVYDGRPGACYRQHGDNQMGYGLGGAGKLLTSAGRALRGDGRRYREQAAYFIEQNEAELERQGMLEELREYACAATLQERLRFFLSGRLYRQGRVETLAFYAAFLLGMYS